MPEILSINNTIFTIMGYPMSYIEFFGTILNILCVFLLTRKKTINWPIGIAAVALFGLLFWQIRLYSDLFEQGYYVLTGFWGWWLWIQYGKGKRARKNDVEVRSLKFGGQLLMAFGVAIGTILLGRFMSNIHLIWPNAFPEAASFPYLDALTTVMSFAAQILLALRYYQNWTLWIAVDVIGIWLYYTKGVKFVSLLYVIFLVLATSGLIQWYRSYKEGKPT